MNRPLELPLFGTGLCLWESVSLLLSRATQSAQQEQQMCANGQAMLRVLAET